jgi:Ni/Fe-hydrogenase b-type cytochrome subunit
VPDGAAAGDAPAWRVGEVLSVGGLGHGRLLALAAAAPPPAPGAPADPVGAAALAALAEDHPGVAVPAVAPEDLDPARPDRRCAVVRLRGLRLADGTVRDVVVLRGELRAVLGRAHAGRQAGALLRRNADHAARGGGRPLVIAAAPVGPDGEVGRFVVQGFVAVHPRAPGEHDDASDEGSWVRVGLWSVSLRYQHWLNVALIFVLSCTGYYLMDPFVGPTPGDGAEPGHLMGWVRLVHFAAGFAWVLVGLTRIVSAFTSRDRYLRWPTLWPLRSRADLRHLGQVVQHYAFLRREAPLYLAHNPLQQLAYTGLYALGGLQIATGLVLYGLAYPGHPFWSVVSMPVHWFGIPAVRLVHAMAMFVLWAFVIMHVYLAVRADSLERSGGVSAMMNGGVWLRRGSRPVDAPEVE